jgi:hypothetical protein
MHIGQPPHGQPGQIGHGQPHVASHRERQRTDPADLVDHDDDPASVSEIRQQVPQRLRRSPRSC